MPVNITYYPLRARENALSNIARTLVENISERLIEELMTEGHMLLSGVDMDIRFGQPIAVDTYLDHPAIQQDIRSKQSFQFDDPLPSRAKMRKSALKVMQRYMTAIYSLTTLNHDHLFASMLKLFPFSSVNTRDFKRRVYLVASSSLREMTVFCHNSLNEDQVHMLVNDCYGKFRDFISLATEQGFVKEQGEGLVKLSPIGVYWIFTWHEFRTWCRSLPMRWSLWSNFSDLSEESPGSLPLSFAEKWSAAFSKRQ